MQRYKTALQIKQDSLYNKKYCRVQCCNKQQMIRCIFLKGKESAHLSICAQGHSNQKTSLNIFGCTNNVREIHFQVFVLQFRVAKLSFEVFLTQNNAHVLLLSLQRTPISGSHYTRSILVALISSTLISRGYRYVKFYSFRMTLCVFA